MRRIHLWSRHNLVNQPVMCSLERLWSLTRIGGGISIRWNNHTRWSEHDLLALHRWDVGGFSPE